MPISPVNEDKLYNEQHWEDVLELIIEATESTKLFEAFPMWKDNSSDQISETILGNIASMDIAICDISSLNANVMFELGLWMATKKPVILLCDTGTVQPFDFKDLRHISYPKTLSEKGKLKAKKELSDSIIRTWIRFQNERSRFNQLPGFHLYTNIAQEHSALMRNIQDEIKYIINYDQDPRSFDLEGVICRVVNEQMGENSSEELITSAYMLGDIYDHTQTFDMAVEMAEIIREIEWNRPKKDLISLKRLIGCTYTCAIAPADTRNRKMDILGESEDWFKKIHEKMESWRINVNPKVLDKSYIYGLYESNMGALHMQYVDNGCEEHLDEALRRYKKSLRFRERLMDKRVVSMANEMRNHYLKVVAQSEENIAETLEKMADIRGEKDKVLCYKEALEYYDKARMERESIQYEYGVVVSKLCFTRCFCKYLDVDRTNIDSEEINRQKNYCSQYLQDCRDFINRRRRQADDGAEYWSNYFKIDEIEKRFKETFKDS